jgi:hypothetical protein
MRLGSTKFEARSTKQIQNPNDQMFETKECNHVILSCVLVI